MDFCKASNKKLEELQNKHLDLVRLMRLSKAFEISANVPGYSVEFRLKDIIDSQDIMQTINTIFTQQLDKKIAAIRAELSDYLKIEEVNE